MEQVVLGGGCFWCTEAVFKMIKGVARVEPGYAGGTKEDATYEKVCRGTTGHAEATLVEYDPAHVSFRDLLTIFFASHDPTTADRQGNDVGPQYRSIIFYTTPAQQAEAEAYIKSMEGAVTELAPLVEFFPAENYHRDYYEAHKDAPYCRIIIDPKLEKVEKEFAELLKK